MASRTTICSPGEVLAALGKAGSATDDDRGLVNMILPLVDGAIKAFLGWGVIQRSYTNLLPDQDMFDPVYNTPWDLGEPFDITRNGQIAFGTIGAPQIIQVPEIPLRSVTSFNVDFAAAGGQATNDFSAATLLALGADYYLDFDAPGNSATIPYGTGVSWTGHIRRYMGGIWPYRMRTALITYVAGITPDELDGVTTFPSKAVSDIKYAAILAAQAAFREMKAWSDRAGGQEAGPIISERLADYSATYAETAVLQATGFMTRLPFKCQELLRPHQRSHR